MSGSLTFTPFATSQPQNTFLNPTQGYMQGVVYDDYMARSQLMGGYLDSGETIVMWGGRPIKEVVNVTGVGASDGLGPDVASATTAVSGGTTGWSVFGASYVLPPGGAYPPVAGVGNWIGFYRNGSLARITVACDPALISTISGAGDSVASQALYWDVTNYRITLTTTGGNWALPTTIRLVSTNSTNSKIITYAASQASWVTGSAAIIQI